MIIGVDLSFSLPPCPLPLSDIAVPARQGRGPSPCDMPPRARTTAVRE